MSPGGWFLGAILTFGFLPIICTASHETLTSSGSPASLLIPGVQFEEEVRDTSKSGWYGLVATASSWNLAEVAISFKRAPYRVDHPGIEITTDLQLEPLFIVRGLNGLKEGKVDTWFAGEARLSSGETLTLTPSGRTRYEISMGPRVPFERVEGHENAFTCDLIVTDRTMNRTQRIGQWLDRQAAAIKWVGDLDRDGEVDLFIYDDSSESGEASWTLFLSSVATSKQIVGRAGSFHRPGC